MLTNTSYAQDHTLDGDIEMNSRCPVQRNRDVKQVPGRSMQRMAALKRETRRAGIVNLESLDHASY